MKRFARRNHWMRPRFRLRTLLLLTALVAAACYWWIARPTAIANRFVQSCASGDFATADRCFSDSADAFLLDVAKRADERVDYMVHCAAVPQSWSQLVYGRRTIIFSLVYVPNYEGIRPSGRIYAGRAVVTPLGVKSPEFTAKDEPVWQSASLPASRSLVEAHG